jgi:hypothetical protein
MELYGVPSGILYGQNERVDELNERIQARQFSDRPLAPNFSSRPVLSKYSHFPIVDRRAPSEETIKQMPLHNVETNFSPATQKGPPGAYYANIDLESQLRNQAHKVQKHSNEHVYVPNSGSDLYKVHVPSVPGPNPHPGLFSTNNGLKTFRQNLLPSTIGRDTFNNHTRVQLRNIGNI